MIDWQVKHAEDCGARGVLLYPDPSEVVSPGTGSDTYPSGRYLPGWATRRDSLWRFGDPLTPALPSRGDCPVIPKDVFVCSVLIYVQRIRGFTTMRYINLRFTYLLTYLLTYLQRMPR